MAGTRYRHGWIPLFGADDIAADFRSKVTLSKAENRAVYNWTGSNFSMINGHLRGLPGTSGGAQDAEVLNNLARRYQLPGSANAYRALGDDVLPPGSQAGKVITSPGLSSVALDAPAGGEFSDSRRYPVMMELYLPEGTYGIPVLGTEHAFPNQREFTLPHNSRFAIEADETGADGIRRVKATVLPPDDWTPDEPAPTRPVDSSPAAAVGAGYDDGPFSPDVFGGL